MTGLLPQFVFFQLFKWQKILKAVNSAEMTTYTDPLGRAVWSAGLRPLDR